MTDTNNGEIIERGMNCLLKHLGEKETEEFISTLLSLPVSTTQSKTTAVMGVGAAKRLSSVKWSIVKEMIMTWVLTFPGAGLIGYLMAKGFMRIF